MSDKINKRPDTITEVLKKRGVKATNNRTKSINYVGKKTGVSFEKVVTEKLLNPGVTSLGSAYSRSEYETIPGSRNRDYEPVYGNSDYTNAVKSDPSLRKTLDNLFGSRLAPEATKISEATVTTVLGINKAVPNVPGLGEQRTSLVRSQNGNFVAQDDETVGIRGVEDEDADIEPFA